MGNYNRLITGNIDPQNLPSREPLEMNPWNFVNVIARSPRPEIAAVGEMIVQKILDNDI